MSAKRPRVTDGPQPPERLSDAALLALVLDRAQNHATQALAQSLLSVFGGLRSLFRQTQQTLARTPGLSTEKANQIKALQELARRYYLATLPVGQTIQCPSDTARYLRARLRDLPHEVFCCLYMDNRHRVLAFEELFRGTIDGTSVYPREVVKQALYHNAAALIVAHNHPSGVAEPSQADEQITRRLRSALELVDIRLLDHFVVGDSEAVSLAGRGLL